jgi:hypothetical protein
VEAVRSTVFKLQSDMPGVNKGVATLRLGDVVEFVEFLKK